MPPVLRDNLDDLLQRSTHKKLTTKNAPQINAFGEFIDIKMNENSLQTQFGKPLPYQLLENKLIHLII